MTAKKAEFDVVSVGGGIAGLTLACLLGSRGISVACIDREEPVRMLEESFDGRTTAISFGSHIVLRSAGLWDNLADNACAIRDIRIMDSDSPVLLEFLSQAVETGAFGWILENRLLRQVLAQKAKALPTVDHIAPASVTDFTRTDDKVDVYLKDGRILSADLVVGADGRGSFTREWMGVRTRGWQYRQRAIVCTAAHENPHNNIAIEHFRPEGPFAVLPMMDDANGQPRSSVVWTEHGPARYSAIHFDEDTFNAALTARFPREFGAAKAVGRRFSYPLGLVHAHRYIAPRMALVAEAAHAMHPIAGQGLNMGLRDIAVLADLVARAKEGGRDLGGMDMLEEYQRRRRFDNMAMAAATDGLNRLFSNKSGPLRLLRSAGLRVVGRLRPAKRFFMHQAMGMTAGDLKNLKG